MRDDLVSRAAVMRSLAIEYNKRRSDNGLKLAWIEKAVDDVQTEGPKRSQLERLAEAFVLISQVWNEIRNGRVDEFEGDVLQEAVYLQTQINRIVWMLNDKNNNRFGVQYSDTAKEAAIQNLEYGDMVDYIVNGARGDI